MTKMVGIVVDLKELETVETVFLSWEMGIVVVPTVLDTVENMVQNKESDIEVGLN